VYGPVRTVVWEGRGREAPPYPDLCCALWSAVTRPAKATCRIAGACEIVGPLVWELMGKRYDGHSAFLSGPVRCGAGAGRRLRSGGSSQESHTPDATVEDRAAARYSSLIGDLLTWIARNRSWTGPPRRHARGPRHRPQDSC
jgi:hypothetical protein